MPFTFKTSVGGLADILRRLDNVEAKVRKKILRDALSQASKPILTQARATVPVETGLTRRSLGRRFKTYRRSGVVVVLIGPRTGFKEKRGEVQTRAAGLRGAIGLKVTKTLYRNPTQTAHLVEKGTRRSAAKPFLRPALDDNETAVRDIIAAVVMDGIRDAAK